MRQVTYIFFCLLVSNTVFSQAYNQACPYDNSVGDTLDFSTAVPGASHDAWMWSGRYVWAIGMKASMTYAITTCMDPFNTRDNDSHISIYTHGGGQALAFNDDNCSNHQYHSTIIFTPPADGDYDILFDEHTGVYCSHILDFTEFYDYYIEVLGPSSIQENDGRAKKLIRTVDMMGKEVRGYNNQIMFYLYDDGTVEKKIMIE